MASFSQHVVRWLLVVTFLAYLSSAAPSGNQDNNKPKRGSWTRPGRTTTTTPSPEIKLSCEKKAGKFIEDGEVELEDGIKNLVLRYHNWGSLLAPAPLAISILGHLILMSNQKLDFPIDVILPTNGFKHIKYPKSFRSTLLQISHSGYMAFLKAHTHMDEIRVRNSAVPVHIKNAVRYLLSKNEKVIELRLPPTLATIKEVANKSEVLSREIVDEFQMVFELIAETISAMTNTKGDAENKLNEVGLNLNLTAMEKKFSDEESAVLEEKKAKLNGLHKRLENRKDNIMIRTLYGSEDFTINLSNGDWLSQSGGRHLKHHDAFFSKTWTWQYTFRDESVENNVCAQKNSQPLQDLIVAFGVYRIGYENWQKSENQQWTHYDGAKTIKTFERLAGELDNCSDIAAIAKKCASLIKNLKTVNFQSVKKTDSRPGTAEIEEIILLVKDVRVADKITEKATGNSTVHKATNLMEMWSISYQHQKKMINDMAIATVQIIALNNKQMEIRRAKTQFILERIASLDVTKLHYKQVLEALNEGLQELGKLKTHWDKLIRFFNNVRLFIESATQHSTALIEIVRTLSKNTTLLKDEVLFEDLLNNIESSNEAVFLVHSIADMYVNVSNTYIMEPVASLDTLNTMATLGVSNDKLQLVQKELSDNAIIAFEGIEKFITEDEKRLRKKLNERHTEIRSEYNWIWECLDSEDVEYPKLASVDRWFQIKSRMNNKVLDVSLEKIRKSKKFHVHMWDSHSGDNQLWYMDSEKIIRSLTTGSCLTSNGYFPNSFSVAPCENIKSNQKWTLRANHTITNVDYPEHCLDIRNKNQENGAHLVEYRCHFEPHQLWDIVDSARQSK